MQNPDWQWMRRALAVAEQGRGFVEPNPLVGAVVVRDGRFVAEGWHRKFGEAHAEVNALAAAGAAAAGATLYVTLEPCCHHGKTPPCTDAILRSGIRRVVAALEDPFPQVAGRSAELLRGAGVAVEFGLGAAEARRLNAPYLKVLATGRPYVHAKWAMTLDGKIASRTGDAKWISNEQARARVHKLRGVMDGIVIGIGTALADDPILTARPTGPRIPKRIVLDTLGRLPLTNRLVQTAGETPTWVVVSPRAPTDVSRRLHDRGCEVLTIQEENGKPSVAGLLAELGRRRLTNLLVEGGAGVLGSFLDAGAIDEVHVAIAPRLLGGQEAKTPFGGQGLAMLSEAVPLADWHVEVLGDNIYVHGLRT
jgi:diaminohydroxyphosphoribosylaminopyrimidine deaminase/5-amino-6-(5-phosphoribosylamino)uracil reductase